MLLYINVFSSSSSSFGATHTQINKSCWTGARAWVSADSHVTPATARKKKERQINRSFYVFVSCPSGALFFFCFLLFFCLRCCCCSDRCRAQNQLCTATRPSLGEKVDVVNQTDRQYRLLHYPLELIDYSCGSSSCLIYDRNVYNLYGKLWYKMTRRSVVSLL